MKKDKKGFTLIELLAVIAILAILVIVAVPSVMDMYKDAKKKTFITQAQNIYKAAEQKFMSDQISSGAATKRYCFNPGTAGANSNPLDLSGSKTIYYDISITDGVVTSFKVSDNTTYSITKTTSPVVITDISGDPAASITIACS